MNSIFDHVDSWLESLAYRKNFRKHLPLAEVACKTAKEADALSRGEIASRMSKLRASVRNKIIPQPQAKFESLVLASLAVKRELGFLPNSTQIAAALTLCEGKIVELRTGEGKTLAAMLAATWLTLQKRSVVIATTNDYLTKRDRDLLGFSYATLGISTGLVLSNTPRASRKKSYEADITYAANQELGFDYLRDHLVFSREETVQKNRDFVIIDEADSVLIDEARTPLIISERNHSKSAHGTRESEKKILAAIASLEGGPDYTVNYLEKTFTFTDAGVEKMYDLLGSMRDDVETRRRVFFGMYTKIFLKKERDYAVKEGKIFLIDEFTGHLMPDRKFTDGLHQALETKEGISPSPEDRISASITYKNLFKMYKTVAGMTGTAYDAREDFYELYGLEIAVLDPYHRVQRKDFETVFFRSEEEKMTSITKEAEHAKSHKIPLLVISKSVAGAKEISRGLSEKKIQHQLLHAEVGEEEVKIIEKAGVPGTITVATNMAGRGADIVIDQSLRYSYGLRVLGAEHNLSRRVDEQLRGRSGRQGQFGETKFFASLDDELFQVYADELFWNMAEKLNWPENGLKNKQLGAGLKNAQTRAEREARESRKNLAEYDAVVDRHRSATYHMREEILFSDDILKISSEKIREIFHEHLSTIHRNDIEKIIDAKKFSPPQKELLEFLLGYAPRSPTLPNGEKKLPRKILSIIDSRWQSYLENIHWLEDWISLVSVGYEDPIQAFAKTADRMFHDMRRDFALSILRIIIEA